MKPYFYRYLQSLLLILIYCSAALLLTGCWDRTEINDLTLITAAAIDKKDDHTLELSVQVFIPKQSGGGMQQMGSSGGGQTLVRSAEGTTIADAMARLQEKFPRRIFWGHDEIFIFGESLAKEGIRGHIDFLVRHPQVRDRSYILVSKKKAKDILRLQPPLERTSADVLREMATSKTGLGVTLQQLNQMLSSEAGAAALSWVEILSPEMANGGDHKSTIPYIAGTAVFKKDKLIGHIDDRATRGVLWLRNEIRSAVATTTLKEANGMISMNMIHAHTDLVPKIVNGHWKITVKAVTDDEVLQNTTNVNIMKPKISKLLEKQLRTEVESHVNLALKQVQKKMKADILGFAEAFHQAYPQEWNRSKDRWEEIFPQVEVQFDIKAHVRRPGTITTPAGLPESKVKKEVKEE